MRSDNVTKGSERAPNRSLFYALGYTPEELERPLIGVVSAHSEIVPGHMNLDKIAEAVKAGLLAQRLDDGADEQTGKQTLCHCAQCVNEVTLRRDDDILPRQKFFQLRHKTCLSIQNRSLRLRTYALYHTIHMSRQQEVAGKNVKFRLCAMFCPAGTYSIWNIFRHTAPVENLCRSPLCR